MSWGETVHLYQPRMIDDDECGAVGGIRICRGNRSTSRKPTPVPLYPPQIPHDLTWARTQATVVGSRRLTAWDMARPQKAVTVKVYLKVVDLGTAGAITVLWQRQTVYISIQTPQNIRETLERNDLVEKVYSFIEGIIIIALSMHLIQWHLMQVVWPMNNQIVVDVSAVTPCSRTFN
jgi:hypothetical protein